MKNQLLKEYIEEVLEGIFYFKNSEEKSPLKSFIGKFFTKKPSVDDIVEDWLETIEDVYDVGIDAELEQEIKDYAEYAYPRIFRRSRGDDRIARKILFRSLKNNFHKKLIEVKKLSEISSNFTMTGLRRHEAPGNIRHGQFIKGSNSSLEKDLSDEKTLTQGASIILVTSGNKVLAVSRGNDIKNMNMPGGGIETGETPEEAASRELYEETGIVAEKLVYLCKQRMGEKNIYFFRAVRFSGDLTSSSEGVAKWEDPETLLRSQYGNSFRKVLLCIQGDKLTL